MRLSATTAVCLFASLFTISAPAFSQSVEPAVPAIGDVRGPWRLVWADEFNTDGLPNPADWSFEQGMVRNHELQNYTTTNAYAGSGQMLIEARRERSGPAAYSSASINTAGKHAFLYGRFEARMKIDAHMGSWPAFWTLGADVGTVGWPGSGEIDIMEYYRGQVLANICRQDGSWSAVATPLERLGGDNFAQDFHVWAMEWDADRIDLFVDDRMVNHFDVHSADHRGGENPFHKPQYILLNLALGGQNGGDPSHTVFPVHFAIDYVRVYEQVR